MNTLKDEDRNYIPDAFENMNIFTDKNKDGIPDLFENTSSNVIISSSTKIIVHEKEFNSIADLPPDVRILYEQALGKPDANQNGMLDFLEGMINTVPPKMSRQVLDQKHRVAPSPCWSVRR